jgi:hypothetical protein
MKTRVLLLALAAILLGGCKDFPSAKNGKHFPADVAVGAKHPETSAAPGVAAAPVAPAVVVAEGGR